MDTVTEYSRSASPNFGSVFILVTAVQGCLMVLAHISRESAMGAAVKWVEADAETRLIGSLIERYEKARRHIVGQGGQMEIIGSPMFGSG